MAMSYGTSVGSRLRRGSSILVPTLVCLFAVIAAVLPYGSAGSIPLAPLFPLAAIYFFVLTRPTLITPIAVFAIGIFHDLLSGGPLGLWALVYLASYGVGAGFRLLFIGRSAGAAWPGFLIIAAGAALVAWLFASIFYQTFVPFVPVFGQMMITAALYPIMAWVFSFFLGAGEG